MAYFHDVYDQIAGRARNDIAVISAGSDRSCMTYYAIQQKSLLLAAGLEQAIKLRATATGLSELQTVAVHLPRTHPDFVPMMVAASRVAIPFVLLSTDLPDCCLQDARNTFAVHLLKPRLCITMSSTLSSFSSITGESAYPDGTIVTVDNLVKISSIQGAWNVHDVCAHRSRSEILCFMFTGGTSRTKVVKVTHAMILHESVAYGSLRHPLEQPTVVLAHTSAYWGASCIGQLSIALAYRGTVVWTEASEAAELRQCISAEKVNILGIVPDHLDLLAPTSPALELPYIEVVFTWGERLPRRTAEKWRDHPRAVLRELLIATEYWLSLWADPLGDSVLRTVPGTKLLVLTDEYRDAAVGELGELMIAGPMVMAGYDGDVQEVPEPFYIVGEERFFRTRDMVRRVPQGIIYKGRADMMAKHKGKWVDMMSIEDQVSQLDGVQAAKVIPDPLDEHFHAFVALDHQFSSGPTLRRIRLTLPPPMQLWLVQELPRNAVTRKVDINKLSKMLVGLPPSWPVDNPSFEAGPPELRERFSAMFYEHLCWKLGAFGAAWAVADRSDLLFQLSLLVMYLAAIALVTRSIKSNSRLPTTLLLTSMWVLAVVFAQPPCIMRIASGVWSLALLTYGWLALTYADSCRASCFAARATMRVVDELPCWKFGAFILFSHGQYLPGAAGVANLALLVTCGLSGVMLSVRRRRFFAWFIVFWAAGIGNELSQDCGAWTDPAFWYENIYCKISRMRNSLIVAIQLLVFFCQRKLGARCTEQIMEPILLASETALTCSRCNVSFQFSRWLAHDEQDRIVCDPCGATLCSTIEATATEWLQRSVIACQQNQRDDHGQPMPKIHRSDSCVGDSIHEDSRESEAETEDATYQQRCRPQWEDWWWRHKTTDTFDLDQEGERCALSALSSDAPSVLAVAMEVPAEMRLLCIVVEEIEPLLKPVHGETIILGIDSLKVARLTNSLRIQLGRSLTVQQIRGARTVSELANIVAKADAVAESGSSPVADDSPGVDREYAVWHSPGQLAPMGHWVLHSDDELDIEAMTHAVRLLVDRHEALRVQTIDPRRYAGLLNDAANVFALYAPFLRESNVFARSMCWQISKAFTSAWPRIKCYSREQLYGTRFPETLAPFEVLELNGGQEEFERVLKQRRASLMPPGIVTAYKLRCFLSDVWTYSDSRCNGRFVIMTVPEGLVVPDGARLVYVDVSFGEWGPLLNQGSSCWRAPPYGFPALFYVPLSSGAVAWIRLHRQDELRLCYREARSHWNRRLVAHRAAPRRYLDCHPPLNVEFFSIAMYHHIADGNCYLPLVQDFLTLYDAARGRATSQLPTIPSAFEELERRLLDTFHCRLGPMRSSLRGSLFGFHGHGFGYCLSIAPQALCAVTRAAAHYSVGLDVVLLGVVVCAMARADHVDFCDFTLYAPMRDGASEAMAVGLFSDWRDLYVNVDFDSATVLGTILQLAHKLQHRKWTVFNALRKPERTVINIQQLDFKKRSGFKTIGESMWSGGEWLNENDIRTKLSSNVRQPASFAIEQQDERQWYVLVKVRHDERPAPWMRRFVESFRGALSSVLFEPLARVHLLLPEDDVLLHSCADVARPICLRPPKSSGLAF